MRCPSSSFATFSQGYVVYEPFVHGRVFVMTKLCCENKVEGEL